MIRKEQIIIGTKEELLDYFRYDLNIALKIDREMWDKKLKKFLDEKKVNEEFELSEEYQKFLEKTVTGNREVGDLRIEKQLESALPCGQVFYFEATPGTVVDGMPTVELILTSIYVRVISEKQKEEYDQYKLASVREDAERA